MFVCVNAYLAVCSFVWLFADSCLLCVFLHLAGHFRALFNTRGHFFAFFLYFGGPWNSIVTLGAPLHFATLGGLLCMFFVLVGTLGLSLLILGFRLGALGVHFGVFLRLWGLTLNPFCDFSGKGSKKEQNMTEKGS